ncbi:PIG-L deacetylase family protein [Pseudomonas putida]|uniref:PIG-L deacetylase family protein n=1 Tax=Pseudomonas putida TaxID=303 RepID=UPI00062B21A2|nr:PIG-L family deacetylase [Pseudomonas putida]KKX57614.1 acetylglucosaminylphosphatidylinositol deacetylase [Pseudomonas putida]
MSAEPVSQGPNLIQGPGTSLAQWQASERLARVPTITHHQLVPAGQRLVVVAPHPDDEVLGCAGILAGMQGREADVLLIAVTDGEASHPQSRHWTPTRLRQQRPKESMRALACMGLDVTALGWQRLGLPDSGVAGQEALLIERLMALIRPHDRVITTWRLDGHCDHEATGRATACAVAQQGACLIEVPVWAWHWARPDDARIPWARAHKYRLEPQVLAQKRQAIAAHVSQVSPEGQAPAVLSRETLERLLQPFELVFL